MQKKNIKKVEEISIICHRSAEKYLVELSVKLNELNVTLNG